MSSDVIEEWCNPWTQLKWITGIKNALYFTIVHKYDFIESPQCVSLQLSRMVFDNTFSSPRQSLPPAIEFPLFTSHLDFRSLFQPISNAADYVRHIHTYICA